MPKAKFLFLFFSLVLMLAWSCTTKPPRDSDQQTALNVILLIGDGMGAAQISTRFYGNEKTKEKTNFTRFPVVGLHENEPVGAKITDSAAGATAFSTGYKSYNGAIGVDGDTLYRETILEIAKRRGKATGLVATSSIVHATPASFYAHVKSRTWYEGIAVALAHAPVDFFAGGGIQFFNRRSDNLNYLDTLKANGFVVDTTALAAKKLSSSQKYGFLLASDAMPKMQQGRGDFLPDATKLALKHLSQNEKGFFLMVEGSQIDWGGHGNDAKYIIEEMKDFDKTIGVALDFAKKEGNTLVIVTADHETGGFSLSSAKVFGQDDYRYIVPTFSTGGHSSSLIPVFAYGPGARSFSGVYSNNSIFDKMMKHFLPNR